jgi:hypothetical protein
MGGLLAELGKRIAERWMTLLVLPGALYLGVLTAAQVLGYRHPFDVDRLIQHTDRLANSATAGSSARLAVVLLAVLLLAAAAGLAAQAVGSFIERLWLATNWPDWPTPLNLLARTRVRRRGERWTAANTAYDQRREEAAVARALQHHAGHADAPSPPGGPLDIVYRRLTRISGEPPARPTWMGDRLHAVAVRIDRDLGLDVAVVWPSLWLSAPDATRNEITAARETLTRAATLAGWGVLYLSAGALWWPGFLIAAAVTFTAWRRGRTATDVYATLVEATVRLHTPELARQLGDNHTGPFTRERGWELTWQLQGHRPTS